MSQPQSRIVVELAKTLVTESAYFAATAEEWVRGAWMPNYEGDGPDALAAVMDLARVMHIALIKHHEANH